MRSVLIDARGHLAQGWVQQAWFAGRPAGRPVPTTDELVRAVAPPAACLVGAVVLAAGGPDAVREQLTQRSLDLLWHTLHRPATDPVRWCPGPALRTLQVQDLTRWNDAPERSLDDVLALVDAAIDRTREEGVRLARC
jgi:hypothetical protein